jgi:hypothetical protein
MGPAKWSCFYLYAILDIFRRRVVDWCVADAETATLFKPLFDDAAVKHNIVPGQLVLHADRGSPVKARATAFRLADLGVTRSHNRPHTSNDNPFSESHFKTLKYQPRFPKRFGRIEDAKTFCRSFFDWYNQDHRHAGIGLITPDQVHYGQVDAVRAARQAILDQAFGDNPGRFVKKTARSARQADRNMDQPADAETSRLNAAPALTLPRSSRAFPPSWLRHAYRQCSPPAAICRMGRLHCNPLRNAMRNPSTTIGWTVNDPVCTNGYNAPMPTTA